ncbi:MAG TPA: hypothetical protein VF006_28655 [Longimicrobium sp.]
MDTAQKLFDALERTMIQGGRPWLFVGTLSLFTLYGFGNLFLALLREVFRHPA